MWSTKKAPVPQAHQIEITEDDGSGTQKSPTVSTPKGQGSFKSASWLASKFSTRSGSYSKESKERVEVQNGASSPAGHNPASPAGSFSSNASETNVDSRFVHVARVVKTHPASMPGQLTIQEGQLVLVTRVGSRGWYFGNVLQMDGATGMPVGMQDAGWFPASFVVSQGGSSAQGTCPTCLHAEISSRQVGDNALLEKMDNNLESRLSGMMQSMRTLLDELEQRQRAQTAQAMQAEIQSAIDDRLERICSSLQSCIAEHSQVLESAVGRRPGSMQKGKVHYLDGKADENITQSSEGNDTSEISVSGGSFSIAHSAPPKAEPETATTESNIGKRAVALRSTQMGRISL